MFGEERPTVCELIWWSFLFPLVPSDFLTFIYSPQNHVLQLLVKGKAFPQTLERFRGFQEVEA